MLTAVIVTNLVIAAFCLYLAWQVWQLSRVLAMVADTVLDYERNTHNGLSVAPGATLQAQASIQQLRQQNRQLAAQLEQFQQLIGLLTIGQTVWKRRKFYTRSLLLTKIELRSRRVSQGELPRPPKA